MKRQITRRRAYLHRHTENKEEEVQFNWLDTGLLIGILTALGYFVAYSYQKGYLLFYGITEVFLNQITIVNVIISISVIGTALFAAVTAYDGFKRIIPESQNSIVQIFSKSFAPYLFIALITAPFTIQNIKIVIFILIGLLCMFYIMPIFTHWKVKGYLNKLSKQVEHEENSRITFESISRAWRVFPSSRIFSIIAVFLLLPHISSLFGYKTAETAEHYFIFKNQQGKDYVVIDKIGDNFIVAPIDLTKQEIKKQYQVIDQKSDLENPLVFEKVEFKNGIKVISVEK
ncbi:hypothetical protein ACFWGC_27585 [Cytobacillus pseudoceanisediminis]|uniref:Uncharacterized protein n=1 Tax=Cytobacillus oceanisediminis TaxID=665099 RepID=A0ABX3CXT7_9BACI|nr:hypothetical protein [Cytobacillus oceanisediminis]OHX49945.1 hypothetical protein BBV17_10645 [Cytobacillus oceanisediminis]